ncbi:MAG: diaminopimelate epimerase [Sphingobacteriales bacterium]|jgi:diaminopimelate epimerase
MKSNFYKYQGTGNDFIIFDDRDNTLDTMDPSFFERICDRKFGIGADGVMQLKKHPDFDFEMVYRNSDGKIGSMCGNGGRCIIAFAHAIGIKKELYYFLAPDGEHHGKLTKNGTAISMGDVQDIENIGSDFILDTGSPHYIKFVQEPSQVNIIEDAHAIRYGDRFNLRGVNVNFVKQISPEELVIRTYERGVEDETLSCGTGVTAAAIASLVKSDKQGQKEVKIQTSGGDLSVRINRKSEKSFVDIWLEGPATFVFQGSLEI